jgi:hypothetical protein
MVDSSELMEETINRVRQGSLDPRSADTVGFLASVHMKAIAEARTERAEKAARENPPYIYQAIFDRKADPESPYASERPPQPLYPNLVEKEVESGPVSLPAPGEPIDDSPIPAVDPQGIYPPASRSRWIS